jgi:hypothetical protein
VLQAQRGQVRDQLRSYSDVLANMPVRAVLAFPGWDVEERRASGAEVWVLNLKRRLATWIRREEELRAPCSDEQVSTAAAMFDVWSRGSLATYR